MEEPIITESRKPQLKALIKSKSLLQRNISESVELIEKIESKKN